METIITMIMPGTDAKKYDFFLQWQGKIETIF
jgi:hypothetical protein